MLARLRLMAFLSHKATSPERVFSTSNSRLLRALDASPVSTTMACSNGGDTDPFGSAWPPKYSLGTISTSSVEDTSQSVAHPAPATAEASVKLAQWPPVRSRVKTGTTDTSSSTKSMSDLKDSTAQPSSISSSSTPIAAVKSVSKSSKENGTVTPPPPIILDPAIVRPLPKYSYKDYKPSPARVYVRHEEEANDLVESLSGAVGFDIEWKVIFRRGASMRPAATVQLSDQRMILVIQVSAMAGFPQKLKELLENPKIAKIGVNIRNDGNKLARDYGVRPQGLIELGGLARQADAHYVERYFCAADPTWSATAPSVPARKMRKPGAMINLAVVTAMYTGRALSKGPVRVSDWEVQPLSEAQLEYAANDAHSALMVHDRLIAMAKAANVLVEPAKYTTGVKPQYGVTSGDKLLQPPPPQPTLPGPALATTVSWSSSTSVSTLASGYDPESSSSASTSTFQPRSSAAASANLAVPATSHVRSKSAFPLTYATVSDSDIRAPSKRILATGRTLTSADMSDRDAEVLEIRDHRTLNRPSLQSHESLPASGSPSSLPKPGPRFKPSYSAMVMPSTVPASTSTALKPPTPTSQINGKSPSPPLRLTYQRPQHIRAYNLWHVRQLPLPEICKTLRSPDNPLKESTVITYVIGALRTDPALCFSHERLRTLMNAEPKSWLYHGEWFNTLDKRVYVNMDAGSESGTETGTGTGTRTST